MKLTKDNIDVMNTVLIGNGIHYIDLRSEIIDHLCSELEVVDDSFQNVFSMFFEKNKKFIQIAMNSHRKAESRKGLRKLTRKITSRGFILLFLGINFLVFIVHLYFSKEWLLDNFDVVPIILPGPITAILLYTLLFSKIKSSDLVSLIAVANLVLMSYVFGFLTLIRTIESLFWIPFFSFYVSLAIAYYYFYFESRKIHQIKYKSLWT